MSSRLVIFDTNNEPYLNNKIFDSSISKNYPGANSITLFYEICVSNGFTVYTSDYVINNNIDITGAWVITEIHSRWTSTLEKKGAILLALICLETPSFAWKFYSRINSISKKYKHCFLFSGIENKVNEGTILHPTVFPQPDSKQFSRYNKDFCSRDYLTLINSNQIRRVFKPLHIYATIKDKSLKQELYSLRLNAIEFFHTIPGFDLYGRNWDKRLFGIPYRKYIAAKKCYKGPVSDKVEKLSNYRFSLCFENAIYKGYITEKIFDCFYATCVPIYLGAPDIESYIPTCCYIDFRNFKNFDDLNNYLQSMTESEYDRYRLAINNFLDSSDFEKFSEITYAKNLFNTIKYIV
jgi:hypothetical protein